MSSGIRVSEEVKAAFLEFQQSSNFGLKVQIEGKKRFRIVQEYDTTGTPLQKWTALQESLEEKSPSFMLVRSLQENTADKFVCVFYCPALSSVRDRMLYASSVNALKTGFGSSMFLNDYHITLPKECTYPEYASTLADFDARDLMTFQEVEALEAHIESNMMVSGTKTRVTVQMDAKVDDAVIPALTEYTEGKINTVLININLKSEVLSLQSSGNMDVKEIVGQLGDLPCYVVHNFSYVHEGASCTKNLFLYYCPDRAKARVKMVYSSVKAKAVSLIGQHGIEDVRRLEFSVSGDISESNLYLDLHPPQVQRATFAKPKAKGRGKRRMIGKSEFKG
jgi:hypothetical protein